MKTSRILLGAIAIALAVPAANARQLTVDEALAAAGGMTGTMAPLSASTTYTMAENGFNTVYVLPAAAGGYLVLSADDVAPAVLGYSDNGIFDPDNIPPAMQGWLAQYSAIIAYAAEHGAQVLAAPANPALTDIAPIAKTRWNQDAPYNLLCPTVESDGNVYPTFTGCVATAVAQVMKTYEYPQTGVGTHSYTWNGQTLSFDYAATTFDWDNMTDIYNSESTEAEKNAVATLMYAVGVSCNMGYSPNGSGTQGAAAAMGLIRNFNYDKSARYLSRDFFTLPQWSTMLHGELAAGHPVYYDGANQSIGHAFVIDGYRSADGFFHVNWGWGGMSDGYYSIVTLDPDAQGIGGSTDGYYLGQSAIFGLKPAEAGSEISPVIICGGLLDATATYTRSQQTIIGSASGGIYNTSLGTVTVEIGLELTPENGGEKSYVWSAYGPVELDYGYGFSQIEVPAAGYPTQAGTYRAVPVARRGNEVFPVLCYVGEVNAIKVEISGDNVTLSPIVPEISLDSRDTEALTPFYRNKLVMVRTTIVNNGTEEYYNNVQARLRSANGRITNIGTAVVDIIGGGSETVTISGTLPFAISKGEATLEILDGEGNVIGQGVTVNVEIAPSGTPSISLSDIDAPLASTGAGTYANPYNVSASDLKLTALLSNSAGYFSNSIRMYFFGMEGGSSSTYLQAPLTPVSAGQSATLTFAGDLSAALETGKTYVAQFAELTTTQAKIIEGAPQVYFHIGENSGVDEIATANYGIFPNPADSHATVTAPAPIEALDVFDAAGMHRAAFEGKGTETLGMDLGGLAAGCYFVRVTTADGNVETLRLIKR